MIRFRDPGLALALFLAVAPATAVLQFRALAPLAVAAMLGAVLLGLNLRGRQGLAGRGPALPLAIGLMLWGAASAAWALDPGRSLFEGARMAGLMLLAGAAAQALAAGPPRRLASWLLGGLLAGACLAAVD